MKICGRCDRAIKPGEKYTKYNIHSASGGGTTVYRHDEPCKPVPYQTTQVSVRR